MDTQASLTQEPDLTPDPWLVTPRYRNAILEVLQGVIERSSAAKDCKVSQQESVRTVPIFDEVNHQYQVLDMGWDESGHRIFQPTIHLELLNGKVWIQENTTDIDLAKALLEWGVKSSDIVLGMHSQSLRRFSNYAIE
jgi:XisI protein